MAMPEASSLETPATNHDTSSIANKLLKPVQPRSSAALLRDRRSTGDDVARPWTGDGIQSLPVDTHLAHVACGLDPLTLTLSHAKNVRAGHEETSAANSSTTAPCKGSPLRLASCLTSPKRNETPCATSPFAGYLPESTHLRSLDTFTLQ